MKKLILILSFIITLGSCNKKKDNSPEPSVSNTNNTTANPLFGDFSTSYLIVDYGQGMIYKDSITKATFFQTANPTGTVPYVYGGNVSVNSNTLSFSSTDNVYSGSMSSGAMSPLVWSASGTGTVAAFNYSYTPNYPNVTHNIAGMDTCIKANGINITLNNIINQNFHGAEVQVYQGSVSASRTITGTSGVANFTASDLMAFNVNNAINISVIIMNYNEVDVGTVRYSFRNNYYYIKYSYLK